MKRSERVTEEQIRSALKEQARQIRVSQDQMERFSKNVDRRIEEEMKMTRKWSFKKVLVTAAAVCVVGSITAVAAGKIVGVQSSSSWKEAVTQYGQMEEMSGDLGLDIHVPEAFSSGYEFKTAMPVHSAATDQEGNAVEQWTGLNLVYSKEGQPDLNISVENAQSAQMGFGDSDAIFEHGGVQMAYSREHYRFVPPNYELSEEEQAQIDAGELVVSYGSQSVEDKEIQSLSWKQGDIRYGLMLFDSSMTGEDMAGMAGEIIDFQ